MLQFFFSMARLTRLLTCYNPLDPIAMGERYGFRVRNSTNSGYDYLTGGAGIVLSKTLVRKIIETKMCDCPSPTAPDDMYLFGYCLNLIDVAPVHSPLFHQVRILKKKTEKNNTRFLSLIKISLVHFFSGSTFGLRDRLFGLPGTRIFPQILDARSLQSLRKLVRRSGRNSETARKISSYGIVMGKFSNF